ncbi:MBL fold metallo-hydrolase [Floccifex sp.]|uniref:MBL fold metallo-hydrolase n=1 Tax=Floccifex sp. TaxID=2815810 RepID=UPI003F066DF0
MQVVTYTLGPVQANCYILIENHHALIVDPGDKFDVKEMMKEYEITIDAILLTHTHYDHIGGVDDIVDQLGCDLYCNPKEFEFLTNPKLNHSYYHTHQLILHSKPKAIVQGKQTIGNFEVNALFCPGHTIGSTVYQIGPLLITGDVLFQGSIGRTDLPTGSYTQMMNSLEKLKTIKENYHVLPGHGPLSTLDEEKKWNPYL